MKKKGNSKSKSFIVTFITMFLILTVAFASVNYALDKIGGIRIFNGTEKLQINDEPIGNKSGEFYDKFMETDRINVLLMGINGHMTDTIMLGSYDMKKQKVDIISIPRDTYYPEKGANTPAAKKINAVYGREGAKGTAEAVSNVLQGVPIHYYVVIKYDGVEKIVDAIGGVPVDIPFNMDYDDPYDNPPLKIHFKKGPAILKGEDAVRYLRYRKDNKRGYGYAEGDVGRVKAQQEFVKSAFKQALGPNLPKVVQTVMKNVDSDLSLGIAMKVATKATGLKDGDLQTWSVEGESGTRNGASYWFADEDKVSNMLSDILERSNSEEKNGE